MIIGVNDKTTDNELVARAIAGDAAAFAQLIDRHYTMMFKVAYKWCGRQEDAEDIAQEVCIKLAQVLPSFTGEAQFSTWLYRIVVNQVRDMQRKRGRDAARDGAYVHEQSFQPPAATQEDALIHKQAYKALQSLPLQIKEAVLLVMGEGMSHKQASQILGCAETTISWRIFQAKKLLSRMAKEEKPHG